MKLPDAILAKAIARFDKLIAKGQKILGTTEGVHPRYKTCDFPLDAQHIAVIERVRQGGSLQLRLDLQDHVLDIGSIEAHADTTHRALWRLLRAGIDPAVGNSDSAKHVKSKKITA